MGARAVLAPPSCQPRRPERLRWSRCLAASRQRRAPVLLGLRPLRHTSVEIDPCATRYATHLYLDVLHIKDIWEFTRERFHGAISGADIRLVLGIGGSPCQGLSGVNAAKQGFEDPRSRLFFEMLRVFQDIIQEKHRLHYLGRTWRPWIRGIGTPSPPTYGIDQSGLAPLAPRRCGGRPQIHVRPWKRADHDVQSVQGGRLQRE